jgi:hypothetical protein
MAESCAPAFLRQFYAKQLRYGTFLPLQQLCFDLYFIRKCKAFNVGELSPFFEDKF